MCQILSAEDLLVNRPEKDVWPTGSVYGNERRQVSRSDSEGLGEGKGRKCELTTGHQSI